MVVGDGQGAPTPGGVEAVGAPNSRAWGRWWVIRGVVGVKVVVVGARRRRPVVVLRRAPASSRRCSPAGRRGGWVWWVKIFKGVTGGRWPTGGGDGCPVLVVLSGRGWSPPAGVVGFCGVVVGGFPTAFRERRRGMSPQACTRGSGGWGTYPPPRPGGPLPPPAYPPISPASPARTCSATPFTSRYWACPGCREMVGGALSYMALGWVLSGGQRCANS